MSKSKTYKIQEPIKLVVNEPPSQMDAWIKDRMGGDTYHTKADMLLREVPDYVWEDIRIGMEQYRRGECIDAFEFIKSRRK